MATFSQRSFAGGELSPSLQSRVDVVKYSTGLKTCRNMFVKHSSGVTSRPGTEYICTVKDSTKEVRLIPFIFNIDQTYMLEFGDQYVRFIRNGVQLTVSGVAAWDIGTGYVIGDLVENGGVNYYCIADSTGDTPPDATYWYPLTDDIYEIPSQYVEADLATINYIQSGDVITLTHKSYPVTELSRSGHTTWKFDDAIFEPEIATPENLAVDGSAGTTFQWKVTAIEDETFEESVPTAAVGSTSNGSTGSPRTLTWDAVTGAQEYNVYKEYNGVYGFIGVAGSNEFKDDGIEPDTTDSPPINRTPFDSADNYPATSVYFQQRLGFAQTNNDPEKCWFTKSGSFQNMTTSAPTQDDDAIIFNLPGRRINAIEQLIDLGNLIALTSGAEILIQGDSAGILRPGEINPKTESYNGSRSLRPLLLNDNAIYVQTRGTVVRDLYSTIDTNGEIGYKGSDLTIFATHLFEGYTIDDWDYAQMPYSIIWCIRSDGELLGLTYLREHQIWAWHHHDTDGTFERVCVIPEDENDNPYYVVKRTIDGSDVKYIERSTTSYIKDDADLVDHLSVDSGLSFDGRNTGSTTMTLTGSGWTYQDTLTLTASASFFASGDVGNQIYLRDADDDLVRCRITAYTSDTEVSVKPSKTVPTSLQAVAVTDWDKAVDELSGLDHLKGKDVSIIADGFVVSSPHNSQYDTLTVSAGGTLTLPKPYVVIHVGLPIVCDIETLNIDMSQTETIADKKKFISKLTMMIEKTRGIWAGNSEPADNGLTGLEEYKARDLEGYESPILLKTGTISIQLRPEWNSNGRIFVRQVDPLPMTISAVMPAGLLPFKGV